MKKILILNGPNLNLLGVREVEIYGSQTFEAYLADLKSLYGAGAEIEYFQSNLEGELIDALHQAACGGICDGVILNAGGYTHTSVSLADAVAACGQLGLKVVEVHISNIMARQEIRHTSLIAPHCRGSIMGFGLKSYSLAMEYFLK